MPSSRWSSSATTSISSSTRTAVARASCIAVAATTTASCRWRARAEPGGRAPLTVQPGAFDEEVLGQQDELDVVLTNAVRAGQARPQVGLALEARLLQHPVRADVGRQRTGDQTRD